jgi:PAS domain S-box-containing protein
MPERSTEDLVNLVGELTRALIWSWNRDTGRLVVNQTFRDTLGEIPADLAEALAWWHQRVHPDDHRRIARAFENALAGDDSSLSFEYNILDRTGIYRVVDDRVTIQRDPDGSPSQIIGAARDITERKRAQEAQARLARILEATPDYVCITTIDGHMLYLNGAARQLLDMDSSDPVSGRAFAELHPEWAMQIVQHEGIPVAIAEGVWEGETAVIGSDGKEIPVSQIILSHTRADGTVECLSSTMRDISERKRQEVTRIEWANRYDAAIRASGQLLIDWNSITNEITYGGNIELFLGYTAAEMDGGLERLRMLVHPEDLRAFDEEIQRVTATRDPFNLQVRFVRKDSTAIYVHAKGYFFLDREGRLSRMVGFLADVTLQREAQEQLARAHDNLEARVVERTAELARAYIVIQDRALQQESVAHLGQQALSGVPLAKLLDEATSLIRTILKVDLCSVLEISPDGRELVAIASAGWNEDHATSRLPASHGSQSAFTLMAGEPVIVENMSLETRFQISEHVRRAGAVSGVSVIIATGEQRIGVLTAFTLTERTFNKDDVYFLQAVANVLTAAIARQRAEESIRAAREQAEKANRAKSEFLSRMSHELRTPLNAILGFTQLLELDGPNASQAESISHISRAGKHLLSLINEVLDIARIEAGRLALSPEPIAISEFLRSVVDLIRPMAIRKSITLSLSEDCCDPATYVMADQQRLKQVMLNLLSNAVKYNKVNGSILVSCSRFGSDRYRISVADTGRGIPKDKLGRLFIPFERLGAETTDIEGTGIGLALSHGIVVALDGQLTVESVEGEGSTFSVDLPAAQPITIEEQVAPLSIMISVVPDSKARTLLYIEDQDLNLKLVERILLHHPNYRLISTMQGSLALDLAREHLPDLILLDLNLPDMSGDEVLSRIKSDAATREIPVLMVSADAMGDRIEKLIAMGAAGYLTKPYKVGEFLKVIEETLAAN